MNKHVLIFVPIFVGMVFGSAILALFPLFLPAYPQVAHAMTFNDCVKIRGSTIVDRYPPVCTTPEGVQYVKVLPRVLMPKK